MKHWIGSWIRSKQPRKQRKYRYNATKQVKGKFLSAHLNKPLREKYQRRSLRLRKGDKVKIMRGQFKKKTGKVARVDLKQTRIYIEGIEMVKKDGSKIPYPIHPSNLLIENLVLEDKQRKELVERKTK